MSKEKEKKDVKRERGRYVVGQSGNPKGRPPGAVSQVLRMTREAAVNIGLPIIIEAAENGDLLAARTLVQLGLPKTRPTSEPEPFPLVGDTLTARASAVIDMVSSGNMSSQVGSEVVGILATAARIEEVEQLRKEVDRLREVLEQKEDEKHGRY